METKPVFVHPPFEELEKMFMQCPTFRERHCWVSDERRKALIVEFARKLTPNDWVSLPHIAGKICYLSDVPADPLKETVLPWKKWYRYEVRTRLDVNEGVAYVVLELEHTFRNKVFGAGLREIWVALPVLAQVATQLKPEDAEVFKSPDVLLSISIAAAQQPSEGLKLDRPLFWLSDQPFKPVEMWEDEDETGTK